MRFFLCLAVATALLAPISLLGGETFQTDAKKSFKPLAEPCPENSRFWIQSTFSYTAESDFERGDDASGDSLFSGIGVHKRVPIKAFSWPAQECGEWFFRYGAEYGRWSFGNEGGLPLPNTLQSASAVLALEYVVDDRAILQFQIRPGFWFEQDVDINDFDLPITLYAPLYVRQGDDWLFVFLVGATYSMHRDTPVIPGGGFVFQKGKWRILGIVPEPRIIYQATPNLKIYAGGELAGGTYHTDTHDFKGDPELNRAVVSYSEWRAGAGVEYRWDNCTVDVGAGYTFQRKFDFHRAEKGYETDEGAPFVKVELRAAF